MCSLLRKCLLLASGLLLTLSAALPLSILLMAHYTLWLHAFQWDLKLMAAALIVGGYSLALGLLACYSLHYRKKCGSVLLFCLLVPFACFFFWLFRLAVGFNGAAQLRAFCSNSQNSFLPPPTSLRAYDSLVLNLGSDATPFCGATCPCSFSTNTKEWFLTSESPAPHYALSLNSPSNTGITQVQQCPAQWDSYTPSTQAFFKIMGSIESSNHCSGICAASNIPIASSTLDTQILTNFHQKQTSCLSPLANSFNKIAFYIGVVSGSLAAVIVASAGCLFWWRGRESARVQKL